MMIRRNRLNAISHLALSKLSTVWIPVFALTLLLSGAPAEAQSSFVPRRSSFCSIAVSGATNEVPVEVAHSFPENSQDRENAVYADSIRTEFARQRTPAILRQIEKMQAIRQTRLRLMKLELEERGRKVSKFKLVRSLSAETLRGVAFELYVIYENGLEVFMGDIFYQAFGADAKRVSFTVNVEPPFRKLGVNTYLAAAAIEDNPQTEILDSTLTDVNLQVFQRELQNGLKPIDAIQRTPALRLRRTLGYTLEVQRSNIPRSPEVPFVEVIAVRDDLIEKPD